VNWVDEENSNETHPNRIFILEKGDCDLASFIESIRKKEIDPTKEEKFNITE
jgi:hypothetical protein